MRVQQKLRVLVSCRALSYANACIIPVYDVYCKLPESIKQCTALCSKKAEGAKREKSARTGAGAFFNDLKIVFGEKNKLFTHHRLIEFDEARLPVVIHDDHTPDHG